MFLLVFKYKTEEVLILLNKTKFLNLYEKYFSQIITNYLLVKCSIIIIDMFLTHSPQ